MRATASGGHASRGRWRTTGPEGGQKSSSKAYMVSNQSIRLPPHAETGTLGSVAAKIGKSRFRSCCLSELCAPRHEEKSPCILRLIVCSEQCVPRLLKIL